LRTRFVESERILSPRGGGWVDEKEDIKQQQR
jgi:hypothetical protein